MPRLPSSADINVRALSPANRAALSYQPTLAPQAYAHANIQAPKPQPSGLAEIGQELKEVGKDLERAQKEQQAETDILNSASAKSEWLRGSVELENTFDNDPEPETAEKRFLEQSMKLRAKLEPMLQGLSPKGRALLDLDLQEDAARTKERIRAKSQEKIREKRLALTLESSDKDIETALQTDDPAKANGLFQSVTQKWDGLLAEGAIDAPTAYREKRRLAEKYGTDWAALHPEKVLGAIKATPANTSPEAIIRNTLAIEGGYSASDGASKAPVIHGINRKYHEKEFDEAKRIFDTQGPEASKAYAQKFFKAEYFDKYKLDSYPEDTRQILFDGMINHHSAFRDRLLKAAKDGATPDGLIAMRREEYQRLGKKPEYAPSLDGWMNRLDRLQETRGAHFEKTGTPLDVIPISQRHEIIRTAKKAQMDRMLDADPAGAFQALEAGEYDGIYTAAELTDFKEKARTKFEKQAEAAQTDRLMKEASKHPEIWDEFRSGNMTFSRLTELENEISPEFANHMKIALAGEEKKIPPPPLETRAETYNRLWSQIAAFNIRTSDNGEVQSSGTLTEYIRFQNDVMAARNIHHLTDEEAEGLLKKVSAPYLQRVTGGQQGWFDSWNDPYANAYKAIDQYVKDQGRDADPMFKANILKEVVRRADAIEAEELTKADRKLLLNAIAQDAIKKAVENENPSLLLLPATPNAIMKPDGTKQGILPGKSRLTPESSVPATFKIMKDAKGNYARVYPDGTFEEISKEEAGQ